MAVEITLLSYVGIDVFAHLHLTFEQGVAAEIAFHIFFIVGFIVAHRPRIIIWTLRTLSGDLGRYVTEY